jgi:ribulose-5-phosphate 4-epimerase/fuculose-1-phosphate aldolase
MERTMRPSDFDERQEASGKVPDSEWEARKDLTVAFRMAAFYGWTNLIYNHIALRVPGEPGHVLFKRHDLLFEEVSASNLIKLDLNGAPVTENENVNAAGFNIHGAVLRARPELNCTLHTHTIAGMAIAACRDGLLPVSQGAMRFYNRISYHDYEGLGDDPAECARIARDLGPKNKAMILRNHGLLTCAETVAQAIFMMKQLVTACEVQTMLVAMGREVCMPSAEVCEATARQWERYDGGGARANLPAYRRIVVREEHADPTRYGQNRVSCGDLPDPHTSHVR